MTTPDEALKIIMTFHNAPQLKKAFGCLGSYHQHLEHPESSPFKIINIGGRTVVIANKNRQLSKAAALAILETWENNATIRTEFGSLNVYRAYVEAITTGRAKIIGNR